MSDEDEYQPQDEDDPDSWSEDVKRRREQLFQEDESTDVEELRAQIDTDMNEWASEVMARNLAIDRQVPPPAKPRIESDFSAFQSSPVRPIEPGKQQGRISKSKPCPTASVVCDTVAATRDKCFVDFFLVSGTGELPNFEPAGGVCYSTKSAPCGSGTTYSGAVPCNTYYRHYIATVTGCSPVTGTATVERTATEDGAGNCTVTQTCTGDQCVDGENPLGDFWNTGGTSKNESFDSEYTNADLLAAVISALPAFDGLFNDPCGAVYDLNPDETEITLQRCKYKIPLSSAACAGMIVSWNEHFVASPSGTVTDTAKTWTATGGETETPAYTIPDPTSNGTTTVTNISVDCSSCTDLVTYQNIEFDA